MAGLTTRYKLPYPTDTDFLTNGDEAIQNLAQKIEDVWGTWTNYTPTLTGFTVGSNWFRWRRDGQTIDVQGACVMAGAVTAKMAVAVPTGMTMYMGGLTVLRAIGSWGAYEVGTSRYGGTTVADSTGTKIEFAGTYVDELGPTIPFTWAASDTFSFCARYETTATAI